MISLKCYSPKGLVVKGLTAEQAESIRAALGPSVCTQHNAKLGGYVFSRKREDRIRELVEKLDTSIGCDADSDTMPGEWMDCVKRGEPQSAQVQQSPAV